MIDEVESTAVTIQHCRFIRCRAPTVTPWPTPHACGPSESGGRAPCYSVLGWLVLYMPSLWQPQNCHLCELHERRSPLVFTGTPNLAENAVEGQDEKVNDAHMVNGGACK